MYSSSPSIIVTLVLAVVLSSSHHVLGDGIADLVALQDVKETTLRETLRHRVSHNALVHASVSTSNREGFAKMTKIDSEGSFTFHWNVEQDHLRAQLVYAGRAWLGFGVSKDGTMRGSDVIIGKPKSKSRVKKYWAYGNRWTKVARSTKHHQTLADVMLVQNKSSTIMSFKRRLTEPDETDIFLSRENVFLFAFGKRNEFGAPKNSYVLKVDLLEDSKSETGDDYADKDSMNKRIEHDIPAETVNKGVISDKDRISSNVGTESQTDKTTIKSKSGLFIIVIGISVVNVFIALTAFSFGAGD